MTQRRQLHEMLTDVADGIFAGGATLGIRATSLELSLPVEVALDTRDGELAVLAELPRFVFRGSFDTPPSRLRVSWVEGMST
jgi:hypothetical protein